MQYKWLKSFIHKSVDFIFFQGKIKEAMYNTMNLYYKYISIQKLSFYKINVLILPISIGEKHLKYSIHFAYICDYHPLWI